MPEVSIQIIKERKVFTRFSCISRVTKRPIELFKQNTVYFCISQYFMLTGRHFLPLCVLMLVGSKAESCSPQFGQKCFSIVIDFKCCRPINGKGTSRQRSGKGAIRKRFPLQKPRWEKTKLTIRYLYHETYRKPNEQLFSQ